jgi:hypothetical protein
MTDEVLITLFVAGALLGATGAFFVMRSRYVDFSVFGIPGEI